MQLSVWKYKYLKDKKSMRHEYKFVFAKELTGSWNGKKGSLKLQTSIKQSEKGI